MNTICDIKLGKSETEKPTNEASILRMVSKKVPIRGVNVESCIYGTLAGLEPKKPVSSYTSKATKEYVEPLVNKD